MNVTTDKKNIILSDVRDFNLRHIFDCGQCFRFNAVDDNAYTGVAYGHPLTIAQTGNTVTLYDTSERDFYNIWYNYFDFGTDYGEIKAKLAVSGVMGAAVEYGGGIRILRQELWETIISFIISASNNIPRIKGIVERLCSAFGDETRYMGGTYYTFPDAAKLSALTPEDLAVIRAGFRDKYILDAADKFARGELDSERLNALNTAEAKSALMSIKGVGNKVSDCILLFGMQRTDSYPIDVWIKRVTEYCFFGGTEQPRDDISRFAAEKFGGLGGYAQQYLFYYARENKIGLE